MINHESITPTTRRKAVQSDLEISKSLALAIGWREEQLIPSNATQRLYVFPQLSTTVSQSRVFDYTDWNVIGPIAERYNCFPYKAIYGGWVAAGLGNYDTPQKAIAMALIKGARK